VGCILRTHKSKSIAVSLCS